MQRYAFNLAPGDTLPLSVAADYIRVVTMQATPVIPNAALDVANDLGHAFPLIGAASMRIARPARAWRLSNNTASTLTGVVLIGEGEYSDNNVAATVTFPDSKLAETVAGAAFIGYGAVTGDNARYVAICRNPAGSGKRVIVDRFTLWLPANITTTPSMAIYVGSGAATAGTGELVGSPKNKSVGGPASVAVLAGSMASGAPSFPGGVSLGPAPTASMVAMGKGDRVEIIDTDWPIELGPGEYIAVDSVSGLSTGAAWSLPFAVELREVAL